jgi:hypothetical protein
MNESRFDESGPEVRPAGNTGPEGRFRPLFESPTTESPVPVEPGRFDPGALATPEYREQAARALATGQAAIEDRRQRRTTIAMAIHGTLCFVALVTILAMIVFSGPELPSDLASIPGVPGPRPIEQIAHFGLRIAGAPAVAGVGLVLAGRALRRWARHDGEPK